MAAVPITTRDIRKAAKRFQKARGFSKQALNTAGNYLDSNDPKMLESRELFREMRTSHNVPPSLCLNYDQTWCLAFRTPKTAVRRTGRLKANQNRITSIINGRQGFTICTSSWADGSTGPLFVSIGNGASGVTDKWIDDLNSKGVGKVFVHRNDGRTHFMNGATTLLMYERLYSPAFDHRRETLNLYLSCPNSTF